MISNELKRVLIVTYDLNLNQTSSKRYLSFIKALSNKKEVQVLAVGVSFPFKSHPINSNQKTPIPNALTPYVKTVDVSRLNIIQRFLVFLDKKKAPYLLKKIFLAVHIVCYKADQWSVDLRDLNELDFVPNIVISGGSGGIIKTSYNLAKKHKAALILDYRDPWNFGYNLLESNKMAYQFKRAFTKSRELKFLHYADKVITVSDSLKSFFPKKIQDKVVVIENGSNYEEYSCKEKVQRTFIITYLGTVYDDQLLDEVFFEAVSSFIKEKKLKKEDVKLLFLGSVKNTTLPKIGAKYNLTQYLEITERKGYDELLPYLQDTRMFLHLKYGERSQIISSKQADYLMLRRPILLPNTDNGDIAESITTNNAGYVCDGKVESIVAVLQLEYDKFLRGESNLLNDRDLGYLSRTTIAEKLIQVIS